MTITTMRTMTKITATTTTTNDDDNRSIDSDAEESRSGFSNGSYCLQNKCKQYKNCVEEDLVKQITVCKPLYEEELLKHG